MNVELTEQESFYINGFYEIQLNKSKSYQRLLATLKSMTAGKLKEGYTWQSKYHGTEDLRPSLYEYDDCFLDFLIENSILEKLKSYTGSGYELYHIQLRRTLPDSNMSSGNKKVSYMDWHRDSYIKDGKILGKLPPAIKVILYPSFSHPSEERLKLIPNSHTIQMHRDQIFSSVYGAPLNSIDQQLISSCKHHSVLSSDEKATIFNTAILHGAAVQEKKQFDLRLIYSFILPNQFEENELHLKTRDTFRSKIEED